LPWEFVLLHKTRVRRLYRSMRRLWQQGLYLALGLCPMAACDFEVNIDAMVPRSRDGGRDASADGSLTDASSTAVRDAGELTDGDMPRLQHVACNEPLPARLPAVPRVLSDATGRPYFDKFRDIDCAMLPELQRCTEAAPASDDCRLCAFPDLEGEGFCFEAPNFSGDQHPLTFRSGQCLVETSLENKIRACCEGSGDFDCRAWPFPQNSKRGELCSVHDDCEPGLLCKQFEEFGLCACPSEDTGDGLVNCYR